MAFFASDGFSALGVVQGACVPDLIATVVVAQGESSAA